ncbi:MAG: hypothetical protein JXC85_01580 [Candidatus Aenigmarchaeota archaeon]|nr:hypothetical protein [Candidatus Aenigmarchaeota archaeon]
MCPANPANRMYLCVFFAIIAVVLVAGCTASRTLGNKSEELVHKRFSSQSPPDKSSMEAFSISYPDWPETATEEEGVILAMTRDDNVCHFRLSAFDVPPDWYVLAIEDFVTANNGYILSEEPGITYLIPTNDSKYTLRVQATGMLCDDKSYFAVFSCVDEMFDEATAKAVYDSMSCERNWTVASRGNRKLAMVVSPAGEGPEFAEFVQAFNIARNSGVQTVHHTVTWGDVEVLAGSPVWTIQDFMFGMLRSKDLEASVGFRVIHTSVIGDLPGDVNFTSFDDPDFIDGYTRFILDYIERYKDVIAYVEIGNEVDIYLHAHPDELDAYATFYREVYGSIKERYPDLPVGTIFAYHEIRNNNEQRIYERLPIGDFDAFTLYIYSPGFVFDHEPMELLTYLAEIENLTGDRRFALTEVGWNTNEGLGGKESDQLELVSLFFDYLEQAPGRLQFMSYFALHDWEKEDCLLGGETFFQPGDSMIEDEEFMDVFSDFLCYLGIINNDGTPKLAWQEWYSRGRQYAEAGK